MEDDEAVVEALEEAGVLPPAEEQDTSDEASDSNETDHPTALEQRQKMVALLEDIKEAVTDA